MKKAILGIIVFAILFGFLLIISPAYGYTASKQQASLSQTMVMISLKDKKSRF